MALTGTTARAPKTETGLRIRLDDLLSQLDKEWSALLEEDIGQDHEVVLRAYYHNSVRVGLYWIGGDPYRWTIPEAYAGERLARMATWLRTLEHAEPQVIKDARASQLRVLRGPAWDAYQAACLPDTIADGESPLDHEVLPFTWEGLSTLWQTDEYLASLPADKAPAYLPQFSSRASEDWHLACLAVLFLNRACKYRLADLHLYTTGDGRA